jgi:hypothetical protein
MNITISVILWLAFSVLAGYTGRNKRIGYVGAFLIAFLFSPLAGFIAAILSKNKTTVNKDHKYVELCDLAKQAEGRGYLALAIDQYTKALDCLEKDYHNLDQNLEEGRQNKIRKIKAEIEKLKQKNLDQNRELFNP